MSEQAYVQLKGMILRAELRPGDRINATQLSGQLGLGRSALQMAIHRLEREGLVDVIPRKGILVKAETLESYRDLIEARCLIEPHLAGLAATRLSDSQLGVLDQIIAAGWASHEQQDRMGSMEADRAFHLLLYGASGNAVLAEVATCLLDRSMRLWFQQPLFPSSQPNVVELEQLLALLKDRDAEAAVRQMREHITSIYRKNLA